MAVKARTVNRCPDMQASPRATTLVQRIGHAIAPRMNDTPIELDKHRGMAAQKATDIRRVIADVETKARLLRDHQSEVEVQLMAAPATSWTEAAAKARYVLNLYAAGLSPADTHHRDLISAVLADFSRPSGES